MPLESQFSELNSELKEFAIKEKLEIVRSGLREQSPPFYNIS